MKELVVRAFSADGSVDYGNGIIGRSLANQQIANSGIENSAKVKIPKRLLSAVFLTTLTAVACQIDGPKVQKDPTLCTKPQISAGRQVTEAISAPNGYVPLDFKDYLFIVKNPDGTENRLQEVSSARPYASLSPNGEQIAFIKNNEVYVVNSDGTEEKQLTNLTPNPEVGIRLTKPAWSLNGNLLAYGLKKASGAFISILNPNTGMSRDLAGVSSPKDISGISWSPDSNDVGYLGEFESGINGDPNSYLKLVIFRLTKDSGYPDYEWKQVGIAPNSYDTRTFWSSDGKTVFWDICQNQQ